MVNPTDYIEFAQKVCLDAIAVGAGSGGMDRRRYWRKSSSNGSAHYTGGNIKDWRVLKKLLLLKLKESQKT